MYYCSCVICYHVKFNDLKYSTHFVQWSACDCAWNLLHLVSLTVNCSINTLRLLSIIYSLTSNVTGCHRGLKHKLQAGVACTAHCRYVAPHFECHYNTLSCCKDYFSSSSAVSHTFSALCMYSMFAHHPHPLGYLCAKFRLFHGLHCWASPWRKSAYSLTHSLTQSLSLFDALGTKARASE